MTCKRTDKYRLVDNVENSCQVIRDVLMVPEGSRELFRHAFRYQWTTEDAPVPQMGETRKGHVNLLTREEWSGMTAQHAQGMGKDQ